MAAMTNHDSHPCETTLSLSAGTQPVHFGLSPGSQPCAVVSSDVGEQGLQFPDQSPASRSFEIPQHVNYVGYGYRDPLGPEIYFSLTPCRVSDVPYYPIKIGGNEDQARPPSLSLGDQEPMEMDTSDFSWNCHITDDPKPYSGIASFNLSFNATTSENRSTTERPNSTVTYVPSFGPPSSQAKNSIATQHSIPTVGRSNEVTSGQQRHIPTFGSTRNGVALVYDVIAGDTVHGSRLPAYITSGEYKPCGPTFGPGQSGRSVSDVARATDAMMRVPHYLQSGHAKELPKSLLSLSSDSQLGGRPRRGMSDMADERKKDSNRRVSNHRYQPYRPTARPYGSSCNSNGNAKGAIIPNSRDDIRSVASSHSASARRSKTVAIRSWVTAGLASRLAEEEAGISYLPGSAVSPRLSSSATSVTEGLSTRKRRRQERSKDPGPHASLSATDVCVTRRKRSKRLPNEEHVYNALNVKDSTFSGSLRRGKRPLDDGDDIDDVDEDDLTDARSLRRSKRRRRQAVA